ncbi:ribonuclease Y [Sedimentibacter hydroxybenzoicus DSM 7310]|uniref:Ribonuclease Y n=1 Tax=Sedimentibacter hydroxybenzoicus DSM 7310 TaxID=1123245 RepID=A0A974BIA3_SEDHY|nr:ribonuclease Y [Sedimentibacter hydroxybenzoicus]NYB73603.1 ribonuclease Y [Sedimentibacter hydroxybenzoicus DSM 7310]
MTGGAELFEIIVGIICAIIGIVIGFIIRKNISESKIGSAEQEAKRIIDEATKDAETKKKEILVEAKDEAHRMRNEYERENKERRSEIQRSEKRLIKKEEMLDAKSMQVEKKDETLQKKLKEVENKQNNLEAIHQKQLEELERISGLSTEEAKSILIDNIKREAEQEASIAVKEIEKEAKENAERKAREIITYAIQKCSADHVAETTVSVVDLPNDEMKGRIIGREGRNIRALEQLTGIDIIIDDTPEAVVISGFDPIRREVARLALEKLIADGRIHPARIEEMVEKAKKEVEQQIKDEGEQATLDTGIHGLHPELVKLLGRLKFRTSYGQNVLKHSMEVSYLAGIMAAELGADVKIAKRAGLLHDIGKAVDHEVEGPHVTIGEDLARKYKESKAVIHGIAAHHGDIEPQTVEAVLVQAADAISAARPGARRETLETYIKRLEKLEEISNSFEGVEKSFAIQAGREVRIIVKPDVTSDSSIILIAKDIVKKIEEEMEYPGQIKVNVIRESRATEYAK